MFNVYSRVFFLFVSNVGNRTIHVYKLLHHCHPTSFFLLLLLLLYFIWFQSKVVLCVKFCFFNFIWLYTRTKWWIVMNFPAIIKWWWNCKMFCVLLHIDYKTWIITNYAFGQFIANVKMLWYFHSMTKFSVFPDYPQ